jgi:hypothetical protein
MWTFKGPFTSENVGGAKPIERDDTYRNNVAPYRSLVI